MRQALTQLDYQTFRESKQKVWRDQKSNNCSIFIKVKTDESRLIYSMTKLNKLNENLQNSSSLSKKFDCNASK